MKRERERNCEEDIKKLIIKTQKRGRLKNQKKLVNSRPKTLKKILVIGFLREERKVKKKGYFQAFYISFL